MFKNIGALLMTFILSFSAMQSFAIAPGAGQAQVRTNMQVLQENQKRMKQYQKNQQIKQNQHIQQQTTTTPPTSPRNLHSR